MHNFANITVLVDFQEGEVLENICCQLRCVVLLRFGRRLICLAGSGLATLLMGAVGGLVLARDAGANPH